MAALQLRRDLDPHLSDNQFGCLQAFKATSCCLILWISFLWMVSLLVAPKKNFYHCIFTGDARPVTQRPYKLSYAQAVWLKGELDRLLKLGVIMPSSSPWMSPVVIVPKPNGGWRVCVDMRLLNKCTQADPYPLPTVEEMHCCYGWVPIVVQDGFCVWFLAG
jgi:hypothetical protein